MLFQFIRQSDSADFREYRCYFFLQQIIESHRPLNLDHLAPLGCGL